jgi:hypothetical protein
MIVQETRAFNLCLRPARDQERVYRSLIEDYSLKNSKPYLLDRKFNLPDYTLVTPAEWQRSTRDRIFAVFSAVGFNQDRTRAVVCYWLRSEGTCSVLIREGSTWRLDRDWHGNGCAWAA